MSSRRDRTRRTHTTLEREKHKANINRLNSGLSRSRKNGSRHTPDLSFSRMLNRINDSRYSRLANSAKREKNELPIAVPVRSFKSLFP